MKKSISIVMLLVFMIPILVCGQDIQLVINGEKVNTLVAPIKREGTTMIPLRVIAASSGMTIIFDSENNKAIVTNNTKSIQLPIDKKIAIADGKEHILQTASTIIDETTMVPIGFITEYLGFVSEWDEKNNTIRITSNSHNQQSNTIQSEIQVPKKYMDEAIQILEDKIEFTNDIEVFTLYAFMNYTGYIEENNRKGFSDVRQGVLEDLTSMDLNLENPDYYRDKQVNSYDYVEALKYMDKAPEFEYKLQLPDYLRGLEDLPSHLKAFYKEAKIEELHQKYQEVYVKEQKKYQELVCPAIAKINYYLKVDNQEVEPLLVNINLLEAYWRGYGLGRSYYYNNMPMILTGPSKDPNIGNIVHEYLHGITTPIIGNLDEVDDLLYLRDSVPVGTQADGYVQWRTILDESIIRGLEGKAINENGKARMESAYNQGFILAPYFYERFDEFEHYNGSLEAFIKKLIVEYK